MIRLRAAICIDIYRAPGSGEIAIYLEKKWWLLPLQGDDFDSQKLFDQILAPCFGLALPDDANIVNVPQSIDIAELQQSVDRAGSVGFALAPPTIEQFMHAADRQLVLPPKSTYFVPKAQSGVFLRSVHDDA